MAYIIKHTDKNGVVNMERVTDMVREKLSGIQAKHAEQEQRDSMCTHADANKIDRRRNGWTGKKKLFRRIAQVPASKLREFRKVADPDDWKAMKGFIKEGGYHTVARDSF